MKLKDIKKEDGFWSAFVLILLTTLALMGMGAYVLMRSEGVNVASQAESLQTEYSATGAVYYGVKALQLGTFNDHESVTIGGVAVLLDTSTQSGSLTLNVTARTSDGTQTTVSVGLEDVAVWTTGNVSNITALDNGGNTNNNLIVSNATSVMAIDITALSNVPGAQVFTTSQTINSTYSSTGNNNFYQSDGTTPNVTIVNGNLTIGRNGRVYGIIVVTGNLTIQSGFVGWWSFRAGRVEGVVYLPNSGSTVSMQRRTEIYGGVLSSGNVTGTGSSNGIVRQITNYLNTFKQYKVDPNAQWASVISSWTYQ